jgi:hypothetical protein
LSKWEELVPIAKQKLKQGQALPKILQDAPKLKAHLQFYFRAFFVLYTERPLGYGGVGRIPITKIWAYADRYCTSNIVKSRFVRYILAMDDVYFTHLNEENKDEQ